MGKGKNRAPLQEEDILSDIDADAGQFDCTQALEELTSSITRRYTAIELQHSLLYLTRRNQAVPGAVPLLCTHCMSSSTNETPCLHGTFPDDSHEAPLLLYRHELIAAVEEIFDVIVVPRGAIPPSASAPTRSPASRQDGHRRSSSTVFPCAQGHSHSSAAGAARCASRPETPRSPSPSESTVSSVSGSVVSHVSAVPSRAQASPGGRVAASPARERSLASQSASRSPGSVRDVSRGWNNWGRVRDALPTIVDQAAPAAAAAAATPPAVTTTAAAIAAVPVAPPVAPAAAAPPPYVAHFDPDERGARGWHWSSVQRATNKLPGNVQFGCATHREAVAAFQRAEANGEVEQCL